MKPIIKVENLSKRYVVGGTVDPNATFRESLVSAARVPLNALRRAGRNGGGGGGDGGGEEIFWALKDINFTVNPGEVVGIIGRNGAGKSTLLKVLSRITEPTTGKIELYGRVGSLLEVGTGFHPELTGRENIYLNGAILGMRQEEIKKKFDEIVDFAEIEGFLDTPVKRYSSGMYTRLAFAVAANLEPEVLIVDEVLAVGDAEFQKKCLGKMKDVSEHGRTVLFVSHNIGAIRQLCNRGLYLENGKVKYFGDIADAVSEYTMSSAMTSTAYVNREPKIAKILEFQKISMHHADLEEDYDFEQDEPILIKFEINIRNPPPTCSLFTMILNQEKSPVCAFESESVDDEMVLKIEPGFLVRGRYSIHTFLHTPRTAQFDVVYDQVAFEVADHSSSFVGHGAYNYGSVFGRGEWL